MRNSRRSSAGSAVLGDDGAARGAAGGRPCRDGGIHRRTGVEPVDPHFANGSPRVSSSPAACAGLMISMPCPPVNDAGGHPIACEPWAGGSAPACRPGTRTRRPARRGDGRGWPSRRPRPAGAPWRRGYRQAARLRRAPTGSGRLPRGEVGLHAVRGWRSDGSTCAMKYGGPAPASIGRSVTKSRSLIVRRWLARTLTLVRPASCLPLSRPANERGA